MTAVFHHSASILLFFLFSHNIRLVLCTCTQVRSPLWTVRGHKRDTSVSFGQLGDTKGTYQSPWTVRERASLLWTDRGHTRHISRLWTDRGHTRHISLLWTDRGHTRHISRLWTDRGHASLWTWAKEWEKAINYPPGAISLLQISQIVSQALGTPLWLIIGQDLP
jgi:hypothetical protein